MRCIWVVHCLVQALWHWLWSGPLRVCAPPTWRPSPPGPWAAHQRLTPHVTHFQGCGALPVWGWLLLSRMGFQGLGKERPLTCPQDALPGLHSLKIFLHFLMSMAQSLCALHCSITKFCPTLCNPMDCSMPGFLSFTTPGLCSKSYPLCQWCHPTISSSVAPFSSCPRSLSASASFPMMFFTSGGQSIGASASALWTVLSVQKSTSWAASEGV